MRRPSQEANPLQAPQVNSVDSRECHEGLEERTVRKVMERLSRVELPFQAFESRGGTRPDQLKEDP